MINLSGKVKNKQNIGRFDVKLTQNHKQMATKANTQMSMPFKAINFQYFNHSSNIIKVILISCFIP